MWCMGPVNRTLFLGESVVCKPRQLYAICIDPVNRALHGSNVIWEIYHGIPYIIRYPDQIQYVTRVTRVTAYDSLHVCVCRTPVTYS